MYKVQIIMLGFIFNFFGRKPLLGIGGSLLGAMITHLEVLQIIGAVFGIVIAVITAIIKILELREKINGKPKTKKTTTRKPRSKSS